MSDVADSDLRERAKALLMAAPPRDTAARRVAAVLDLVLDARSRGVGWTEIGQRLAAVGIARPDGQPLPASALSLITRRLTGKAVATKPPVQHQAVQTPASKPSPPRQSTPPLGEEGEFSIPEVEALFKKPPEDRPPTTTIDQFLKEKNR
ncbi:MAG TPA: hypothetical protein VK558_02400 [Patescibacteria group bacterium]|nr:hypothetical protein [Patescibacteria group bacterium]